MKQTLKRRLLAAAPEWTSAVLSARARAHSHCWVRECGLGALTEKLVAALGPVVQSGPFRGLSLTRMTHREHLGPFLLGTYEYELHPWFESLAKARFAQVLDVGAEFGYYAVGLARIFPDTPVFAFDPDWWARAACREMAQANVTPNVSVRAFCSPRWLDRNLQPGSLIVSDCEGYERELLTRSRSQSLASATLIVETHDEFCPGATSAIRSQFALSHQIATVSSHQTGRPNPPVDLGFLSANELGSAKHEIRPDQSWLLLTPRSDCASGDNRPHDPTG